MKTLLRVAIPTYNRCESLIEQLNFFRNELNEDILHEIDFIVYNNASSDNTKENLSTFSEANECVKFTNNPTNLGLVGNINKIFIDSEATYTWAVGDDDILEAGILKKVLDVLRNDNEIEWIFINHDAFDENTKKIKMNSAVNVEGGFHSDGKQIITDIFKFSRTTPMFITACVFKTNTVKEIIYSKNVNNLVDPLEYSFYCASKGKIYLFDKILIHNKWGTTSWNNEVKNVMYSGVFSVLRSLKNYGYSKKQITLMMRENLKFNLVSQFTGLLKADYFSFKLFRYYNTEILKQVFVLFFNKIKNLKNC